MMSVLQPRIHDMLNCFLQTFRAIKCFLGKLEKVSENPELALEAGKYDCRFIVVNIAYNLRYWPH